MKKNRKSLSELIMDEFTDVEHIAFREKDGDKIGIICNDTPGSSRPNYHVLFLDLGIDGYARNEYFECEDGELDTYADNRKMVTEWLGTGARKINIPFLKQWYDQELGNLYVISLRGKTYFSCYCIEDFTDEVSMEFSTPVEAALDCPEYFRRVMSKTI